MATISFHNHNITLALKEKTALKVFILSIFAREKVEAKKIDYIFCNDEYLLTLNQQYLNHDTYTDIITFTLSESSLPTVSEIYISVERVKSNASELQIPFEQELLRVMFHGVLHLCGYSDHNPILKSEMRQKEDYYLKDFTGDVSRETSPT